MPSNKTIWECPVFTSAAQLDGAQRLILQASAGIDQDNSLPLSLLAQWAFSNYNIGLFSGTANPLIATGQNGDLYLQAGKVVKQKIGGVWVVKWNFTSNVNVPVPFSGVSTVIINWQTDTPPGFSDTYATIFGNMYPKPYVYDNTDTMLNFGLTANRATPGDITTNLTTVVFDFGIVQTGTIQF